MLTVSLLVNVLVLIPVCIALIVDAPWVQAAYGPRQPARQVLLAIYLSILTLSLLLLFWDERQIALGLLLAQIVYKILSPITVGTLRNPVVLSNLAIAALHATTALLISTR